MTSAAVTGESTASRPRVCLITAAYPTVDAERHGGTTYASTMAHALHAAGADVEVVCYSDGLPVDHERYVDGEVVVHHVRLPWWDVISFAAPNLVEGWALVRHVKRIGGRRGFDAIEGPNVGGICWAVMLAYRSRFWLRMHTSRGHDDTFADGFRDPWRHRFRRWLDGFTARRSRHLLTHSQVHAAAARAEYRLGDRHIDVVPHGVTCSPCTDAALSDAPLIGSIGMLTPRKAPDVLLAAFELVASEHRTVRLVMIGEDAGGYQEQWHPVDVDCLARVEFTGLVTDAELARRWQTISVLVVASRYESFGLVAAEAMCRSIPLIVTDAGALPEVVGDAAVIVPVDSPERLAAAIIGLLNDPAERSAMARKGRARHLTHFTPDRMGSACLKLFLGEGRAASGVGLPT